MAENHPANALLRSWFDLRVNEMREPTRYVLACRICRAFLSNPVRAIVTYPQLLEHCENHADGLGIASGWFLAPSLELRKVFVKETGTQLDVPGSFASLGDVSEMVKYTKPRHKLIGCCGINGDDGPNRACICGAIVGTEFSECFQTQRFEPDMKNTEWIRLDKEELTK